jgi:dTDP-4-dehydrorhamnose reductase
MKTKVIVLGSSGMAGHVVTVGLRSEPEKYDVIDVSRSEGLINPSTILDATDFKGLASLIKSADADFIVNCIGLLNQVAEDNPDEAILINSYLPHFLETKTKATKTKVIHISTDCVFSGQKGDYAEEDFKDGIGFYAQSKALGEIENKKDLTIRTSIIGPELKENGIGLFNWYSKQSGETFGFTKAFWTGVTVIELGKAVRSAMEQNLVGLIHLVNDEKITKHDLLLLFNEVFLVDNITILEQNEFTSDKSVVNTRGDFKFTVASYKQMIKEMKVWMKDNQNLYPHYARFF